MKFRVLSATLLSCILATTPAAANTEINSNNNNIQKEISSKITEIDHLMTSLKSTQNHIKAASSSYSSQASKADQEQLIKEANNIHIEVENYFNTVDSDDFYASKQTEELINKLDQLDLEVNKAKEANVVKAAATSWRAGDILYYGIGNNSASGEKSFTGHTAILSTTDYYVIEASKTKSNGAKVHHWNRTNLWKGASGIKQYKVTSLLGKDAPSTSRKKAVQFGLDQVGDQYKLATDIFSSKYWYCSKLTMRQWHHAGYDLRGGRGLTVSGFLLVIPRDIQLDANTRLLKDWGTKTPGVV
ncbi:hypothetical protein RG959_08305 [Domibacillus sp. 8LH]|uniref:hypothetical protein n=1 Tax=Domibacillus sp. 8LH TaxID=3073900 RepID=UPI00317F9C20